MGPREIENFFHEKIPLTRAMGVKVDHCGADGLVLTAPLEENHNHLGTAFGGSLGALATLAGYGFVWLALGEEEAHVVIRDSVMSFQKPVRGMLRAVCRAPGAGELEAFFAAFRSKGKARIRLKVEIRENGEAAVEFEGTFVALR